MHDLIADGNSVLLVDHDSQILSDADWIIEMGPGAGSNGGEVGHSGNPSGTCRESRIPDRAFPHRQTAGSGKETDGGS